MNINAIVAMSANRGIGLNNKLPWRFKDDMLRFKKITIGKGNNVVIMGKNTWESVGILPGRHNFILSTTLQMSYKKDNYLVQTFETINDILSFVQERVYDQIWVIGGSKVYESFLDEHLIDRFYVTVIDKQINCDSHLCPFPDYYLQEKHTICDKLYEENHKVYYNIYKKINEHENSKITF
jgi:dihydrofolate reductase